MKGQRRAPAATPRRPRRPDPELRAARRARLRRAGRRGAVLVLLVALVGGAGYGLHYITSPEAFPLQAVRFDSQLERVRERDLRDALDPHLQTGFWGLDVGAIRNAVEGIAWVEAASVRRVWPGTLRITIEEHEAMAEWNEEALLSTGGVVFSPDPETWPAGLPRMAGPGDRPDRVSRRFGELHAAFGDAGLDVEAVAVDARESWSVTLAGGATVALGREDVEQRVRRFVRAFQHLVREKEADPRELGSVDLRYPNGFAIRWADAPGEQ